jgi:CysZ protein
MKTKLLPIFFLAFRDLFRPKVILLCTLPFILSFIFWGIVTYFSWSTFTAWGFAIFESQSVQAFLDWTSNYFSLSAMPFIWLVRLFIVFALIMPLALISALLITSIILIPMIVEEIRKNDFPTLVKKSQSFLKGSTATLSISAKYFFSWIGTMPLWFIIPGGSLIVPFLLLSWFNSRLFTWEVLIECASREESKVFVREHSFELWLLGLLTSILYFVPVLNFIAPVITGAAFSRYVLTEINNKSIV